MASGLVFGLAAIEVLQGAARVVRLDAVRSFRISTEANVSYQRDGAGALGPLIYDTPIHSFSFDISEMPAALARVVEFGAAPPDSTGGVSYTLVASSADVPAYTITATGVRFFPTAGPSLAQKSFRSTTCSGVCVSYATSSAG